MRTDRLGGRQRDPPGFGPVSPPMRRVFRFDEIKRVPLKQKLSGVFKCKVELPRHRLLKACPKTWHMPHSRTNGLDRRSLEIQWLQHIVVVQKGGCRYFHQARRRHARFSSKAIRNTKRKPCLPNTAGMLARSVEAKQLRHPPFPAGYKGRYALPRMVQIVRDERGIRLGTSPAASVRAREFRQSHRCQ